MESIYQATRSIYSNIAARFHVQEARKRLRGENDPNRTVNRPPLIRRRLGGHGCGGRENSSPDRRKRVFAHKLYQAVVNGHVLFVAWCNIRLAEARESISGLRSSEVTKDTMDEIESLEQVANKLDTLSRTERLAWDRALPHSLMTE